MQDISPTKRFNQTRFSDYMAGTVESFISAGVGYDHPLMVLLNLELNGGACPKCGSEWNEISVQNSAAKFRYHGPSCRCYTRCPECKTSFHREEADGQKCTRCVSCGWKAMQEKVYRVECDKCGHWFNHPQMRRNFTRDDELELRYERLVCPTCLSGGKKTRGKPMQA